MSELKEAYRVMQRHCGIEVGDTAIPLRKYERGELGYSNDFNSEMMAKIGKPGRVTAISNVTKGYFINGWWWPFFVLELVEKAHKLPADVSFGKDGLTVGGVFVSKETIRRNLDL